MGKKTGIEFKFYVGTSLMTSADSSGVTAASFAICTSVADVKLNRGSKEADLSTRGNKIELTKVTLLSISLDVDFKYDPTDTQMTRIEDAYHSGALVAVADMSDLIATDGARGMAANWSVTKADRDESLDGAGILSVTLKPTEFATPLVIDAG
jgi:hypothetical protein